MNTEDTEDTEGAEDAEKKATEAVRMIHQRYPLLDFSVISVPSVFTQKNL